MSDEAIWSDKTEAENSAKPICDEWFHRWRLLECLGIYPKESGRLSETSGRTFRAASEPSRQPLDSRNNPNKQPNSRMLHR